MRGEVVVDRWDADDAQPPGPPGAYRAAVQAFGEIAGALNNAPDPDGLLRLVGRRLCELVGSSRCSVYLKDRQSELFRGQVGWARSSRASSYAAIDARIKQLVAGTDADAFTREIVATRRPVLVADARADPRAVRSTMRSWGVQSMLGVPMVLRGDVMGIVFLDDEDQPHVYTAAESEIASTFANLAAVAIAQAQMTARLRQSVRTVARQNDLLRRAAAMHDTLTALVLAGGSLAEIATTVADLSGKPCEIYDARHRRLAAAVPPWTAGPSAPWALDRAVCGHPAVREALEALGPKGSGIIGPMPEAGLATRCLVAPIATRDDVWGLLAIIEHGSRFGPLDTHIARHAAVNVAVELAAERRAAYAEWDARASLAAELIRGTGDPAALRRRAEFLGADLAAPHVVCLVAAHGDGILPGTAEVAHAFATRMPRAGLLATAVAEGVLVIVPVDRERPPLAGVGATAAAVQDVLEALESESTLRAAISTRCTDARAFVRAYEEARQVMSCVRSLADDERAVVLTADDLGSGRLLLASSSRAEAERFAHDALGPLLAPGDDTMAELLRTLQVFFAGARSVRRAAERLGVHENTIRYRLARINDLTGLAVGSDSDDDLTAHLALLIVRVQRLAKGDVDARVAGS